MEFIRSLITTYKTAVLGHLPPIGQDTVGYAQKALREGWLLHDPRQTTAAAAINRRDLKLIHYLDELESGDHQRQRTVLADAEFHACLTKEYERPRKLAGIRYFHQLAEDGKVRLKDAEALVMADYKLYRETPMLERTSACNVSRAQHFPALFEDAERLEAARFCAYFIPEARLLPSTYDPAEFSEDILSETILKAYAIYMAPCEDKEFEQTLTILQRLPDDVEPRRILHYAGLFKDQQWRDRLVAARQAIRRKQDEKAQVEAARVQEEQARAEALRLERERAERLEADRKAAEKRKMIEDQVTFTVTDEVLDVSLHGWPDLASLDDQFVMFQNIKSAFAKATKVRLVTMPSFSPHSVAERGIRSMSNRQLACVKWLLWRDRLGLLAEEKDQWRELKPGWPRYMIKLMNADGQAHILSRDNRNDEFKPEFKEIVAKMKADIEAEWHEMAEVLEKWISTETFSGEVARWVTEDPRNSTGWAPSR